MLRKIVSALLVCSWIILSGLDVVEDLDLPDRIEFQDTADAPSATTAPAGLLARNIIETATHAGNRCSNSLEQFTHPTPLYIPHGSDKVSKLHKVHHVFII
jgi:hypothetical protein